MDPTIVILGMSLAITAASTLGLATYAFFQDQEVERWIRRSDYYQTSSDRLVKYLPIQRGVIDKLLLYLKEKKLDNDFNEWCKAQGATPEPDPTLVKQIEAAMGQSTDVVVEEVPPPKEIPVIVIPPEKMEVLVPTSRRLGFLKG